MGTNLIGFPFSLNGSGNVTTLPDDSDDYYAGELAMLCMTHLGERELAPDYGITDPTFQTFDDIEFIGQVETFGPPVKIVSVDQGYTNTGQYDVSINFESVDTFNDSDYVNDDAVVEYFEEEL